MITPRRELQDQGARGLADMSGKPPPTFAKGRVCAVEGCGTRLSQYNGEEICARFNEAHVDWLAEYGECG